MVVLVRCSDDTCVPALEKHLSRLIHEGLITAFLRDGIWVSIGTSPGTHDITSPQRTTRRLTATVAPL